MLRDVDTAIILGSTITLSHELFLFQVGIKWQMARPLLCRTQTICKVMAAGQATQQSGKVMEKSKKY